MNQIIMNYSSQNPDTNSLLFGSPVLDWEQNPDIIPNTLFLIDLYEIERNSLGNKTEFIYEHLNRHPDSALVVNCSHESIAQDIAHSPELYAWMKQFDQVDQCTILCSQTDVQPSVNSQLSNWHFVHTNYWEISAAHWSTNPNINWRTPEISRFLCLNRRYTAPRAYTVMNLQNTPGFDYTLGNHGYWNNSESPAVWQHRELRELGDPALMQTLLEWQNTNPWKSLYNTDEFEGEDIFHRTLASWIHIVVESRTRNTPRPSAFITEKTFRTVACTREFYTIGEPGITHTLQQTGYEPFVHTEGGWQAQAQTIIELVKWIATLDARQFRQYRKANLPQAVHNAHNLRSRAHPRTRQQTTHSTAKHYYSLKA